MSERFRAATGGCAQGKAIPPAPKRGRSGSPVAARGTAFQGPARDGALAAQGSMTMAGGETDASGSCGMLIGVFSPCVATPAALPERSSAKRAWPCLHPVSHRIPATDQNAQARPEPPAQVEGMDRYTNPSSGLSQPTSVHSHAGGDVPEIVCLCGQDRFALVRPWRQAFPGCGAVTFLQRRAGRCKQCYKEANNS